MLKELEKHWDNHKIMVRWFCRFFDYLDRYYVPRHGLTPLKEVGMICFRELVFLPELKENVRVAVVQLKDKERNGEQIDHALVQKILEMDIVETDMAY